MESFLCDNPVVLQDAAKFGLKSWVMPFAILFLGWRGTKKTWLKEKKFHAKLIARNFTGEYKLKFPWVGPVLSSLAFVCLSFFVLQDRATKLKAIETGEYSTYQGTVAGIKVVDKGRVSYAKSRVYFNITGYVTDSDGRSYKIDQQADRVTTKRDIIADWGNNCSGYTCGISVGDKVRIKKIPVKVKFPTSKINDYYAGDTLSIEKCETQ